MDTWVYIHRMYKYVTYFHIYTMSNLSSIGIIIFELYFSLPNSYNWILCYVLYYNALHLVVIKSKLERRPCKWNTCVLIWETKNWNMALLTLKYTRDDWKPSIAHRLGTPLRQVSLYFFLNQILISILKFLALTRLALLKKDLIYRNTTSIINYINIYVIDIIKN